MNTHPFIPVFHFQALIKFFRSSNCELLSEMILNSRCKPLNCCVFKMWWVVNISAHWEFKLGAEWKIFPVWQHCFSGATTYCKSCIYSARVAYSLYQSRYEKLHDHAIWNVTWSRMKCYLISYEILPNLDPVWNVTWSRVKCYLISV